MTPEQVSDRIVGSQLSNKGIMANKAISNKEQVRLQAVMRQVLDTQWEVGRFKIR